MISPIRSNLALFVKYGCLISFLVLSNAELAHVLFIQVFQTSLVKFLFCLTYLLVFATLFLYVASLGNRFWRLILLTPFILSAMAGFHFFLVTGHPVTIDALEIAILNHEQASALASETAIPLFQALGVGGLAFIGIIMNSTPLSFSRIVHVTAITASIVVVAGTATLVIWRSGYGMLGLPVQVSSLFPLPITFFSKNFDVVDRYEQGSQKPVPIVLIFDESVSFDHYQRALSLTNQGIFPPLSGGEAMSRKLRQARSFKSLHNCSAQAVWALLNGLSLDQDNALSLAPSLWQRAKTAGYQTFYISAQEKPDQHQYLQNPTDLAHMDARHYFGNLPKYERDDAALTALRRVLQQETLPFIVLVKNGSHFPYRAQVPKEYLADLNFPDIIEKQEQSYLRSIYKNSLVFLNDLVTGLPKPGPLIFYTSDHGQNLDASGFAHCNSHSPHPAEWSTPVLLLNAPAGQASWPTANTDSYDRLVKAMGYLPSTTRSAPSQPEHLLFYGSINKRLSEQLQFTRMPVR